MSLRILLNFCLFSLLSLSGAQAATLTASGVKGLEVDGVIYDVAFVDGSCVSLFEGCSEDTVDFVPLGPFGTQSGALAATTALFNLIKAPGNEVFDQVPETINGCEFFLLCKIYTVYGHQLDEDTPQIAVGVFFNYEDPFSTICRACPELLFANFDTAHPFVTTDLTDRENSTYAVWTVAPAPVPVPASLPLLIAGLGVMATLRRRRPSS